MKKIICIVIASVFILSLVTSLKADDKFNPKLKLNSNRNFSKEIMAKDYNEAVNYHRKIAGSLLGLSLDIMLGYGSTNPSVNTQIPNINTKPQGGVSFGALLNISLFSAFNLTTGIDFINKKYEVEDALDSLGGYTAAETYKNNYINVPLNANFHGMLSDDIGLSFSGGPYFGFLLNPESAAEGFKDFDLGLNGILTGNYLLNSFTSIILGGSYQYGGLNNLLSSANVESVHTNNWSIFTGLRFGF